MSRTMFSSGARTATANSARFRRNANTVGLAFHLDISAASGTSPTLDVKIQAYDAVSGTYVDVTGAAFAQKTGTGTSRLVVHPALTASANVAVSQLAPEMFRAVATIGGTTPSFTFSLVMEEIQS